MGLPLNVTTLQRLDRWVFAPVCLALTLVRRLTERHCREEVPRPRSLLFVKLAEQGSSVLAIPAFEQAVALVGRGNVHALVFEENRAILDVLGIIPPENIHTVDQRSLRSMVTSTLRQLRKLRGMNLDAAVDLEFFARFSAALTFLSGARWRSGLHAPFGEGPCRGDLMTHRVLFNPHLHTSRMFLTLTKALDHPPDRLPTLPDVPPGPAQEFPLPSDEGATARVRELIRRETGLDHIPRIVLLNPNSGDFLPLRRWPAGHYRRLARLILEAYPDVHVALTGAPGEEEAAELLKREVASPRCFSLAGKTTLPELMALYAECALLVTNDSGPAHFASLTPIRVITLFGPETPRLFAAESPRSLALSAGLACSPCINAANNRQSACTDNQCMQRIGVEEVFEAVRVRLGTPAAPPLRPLSQDP